MAQGKLPPSQAPGAVFMSASSLCYPHVLQDHPFGYVAKPEVAADGSTNILKWHCKLPGKAGTLWEGGMFPLTLEFSHGEACSREAEQAGK
jgi:hypothetical protein